MQNQPVPTLEVSVDATELERVYTEVGPSLQRAVLLYSGDADVASESVAEAFAQALRRGEAVRDPAAWVWRAAFRIAAGELQRRRRTPASDRVESSYEIPPSTLDLMGALDRLTPKQRAAVVLHHFSGYPAKDVARIIGSTQAAVFVHLSQGRRRLRELLEVDDD
jgi:RNA polymerase sigma-70 factor (ECF subfamily)